MADLSDHKMRLQFGGMGTVEARSLGLIPTIQEERVKGVRPQPHGHAPSCKPQYQPPTHVYMKDHKKWVGILIDSGIPLEDLDHAFRVGSPARLWALTRPILKSTPLPGTKAAAVMKELKKLTAGVYILSFDMYKVIKPIYWKLRESRE